VSSEEEIEAVKKEGAFQGREQVDRIVF